VSRRPTALVGGVALVLALAACTGAEAPRTPDAAASSAVETTKPDDAALRRFYDQKVAWSGCGSDECTRIEVPLDYADPAGDSIELAVLRRPASGDRIGSLLVNPGGPGVSGISYAQNAQYYFSQDVLDRYDIVGWDPRGAGASTAVECLTDAQTDVMIAADGTPDSPAEVRRLKNLYRGFTAGCERGSGDLLPHIGTFDSARDIDILRAVLGERQTDYFGASYGTELGATYADLFPERVGRMVLDGALDPAVSSEQLALGQLEGFQRAITAFVDDCIPRDGCPLGPTREAAMQQLQDLFDQADAQPLPSDSGRPVTEALTQLGVIAAMYNQSQGWPTLRLALARAFSGDGTVLLALADSYSERNDDGTYASNVNEAFPAISCTDRPESLTTREIVASLPTYRQVSPLFGDWFAWSGAGCASWPVDKASFPRVLKAKGAAPIVVIGTTRDPATPYEWAVSLADELQSGVLLSRDGDGHTAYASGNACIDTAVDRFLIDGVVPEDGTEC
jgi:pimeloyl-ACP methyl ester carboxylesterase